MSCRRVDYHPTNERRRSGMAELTTAVELERRLEGDALLRGGGLRVRLLGGVERGHVGLVVLLVVKLHDLAGDERLERVVRVRKIGELVLAGHGEESIFCGWWVRWWELAGGKTREEAEEEEWYL